MTYRCVIALGANLGDRATTMKVAAAEIGQLPGTRVIARSSLYQSAAVKPAGVDLSAPEYLNAVILVETEFSPLELLSELHRIEQAHGRVRHERWGDRTLDLDIIDYDGISLESDHLTLPHPRAHERSFVMVPWAEIDPTTNFLGRGSVADIAAGCSDPVQVCEPAVSSQ